MAVKYELFQIVSANGENTVNLYDGQFRVLSFDYYESIISPHITGSLVISSSTGAAKSKDDAQERVGSLYSSLPLRSGCVILASVKSELGKTLDFHSDPYKRLYVTDVSVITKSPTSENIVLKFTSKIALMNETSKVNKHYKGKITDSIKKIIKEKLKINEDKTFVDESVNSYSFTGMRKRPFDLFIMLARQTVPSNTANPGYFCFETKSGFSYLSADTLINQKAFPKKYFYNGITEASVEKKDDSNDYKVESLITEKDQSLLSQIRSGVYASKNIFFNPSTCGFTEVDISVGNQSLSADPKFSSLGKKEGLPNVLAQDFNEGNKFHRVQTAILDIGADETNIAANNSPELHYAAGTARYNLLFSQSHAIQVPLNTDLEAGFIIDLEIESTSDDKEQGPDQVQSGSYIIKSLCHHIDATNEVTSMKLIRDSYGLHVTGNE